MSEVPAWLGSCIGSGHTREQLSPFRTGEASDNPEDGWVFCRAKDIEHMHRMYAHILHYIRDVEVRAVHPDTHDTDEGLRVLSDPLEECPDPADNAEYYEQIACPTSLQAITHRIVHCEYAVPALFEQDMLQLFSNAREWYGIGTEGYGEMATLLRLYNELTPSRGRLVDGAGTRHMKGRANDVDLVTMQRNKAVAQQHFASSPYGPGNEPPASALHTKVLPLDVAVWKGKEYRVGDWVHIMNPVDPSRPIVGQLFRVYKRMQVPGIFFTACWYYRPEQTSHPSSKQFAEREVVQTGVYSEHALEDILEDVLVLFHTTYLRGRPSSGYWHPTTPVYMVEQKYDIDTKEFHSIRSWASCVPAAVREITTPMDAFSTISASPERAPSLLAQGQTVPGGSLREEYVNLVAEHDWPTLFEEEAPPPHSEAPATYSAQAQAPTPAWQPPVLSELDKIRAYATFHALATQIAKSLSPAAYQRLQRALQANPNVGPADLRVLAMEMGGMPESLIMHFRDAARLAGMLPGTIPRPDATMTTAAAIFAAYKQGAVFDALPEETKALFLRDAHDLVLWNAAPPLAGWPAVVPVVDGSTQRSST
ncbi:rsc complex protein [Malassezia pachydermatis]|uniref:Rsc complex protein n=1 Tax=Malassezia pachydermatis TaxID=77020 RepID=A0A0M8MX96_9BASI|nr:rsc complex protein [Malassezia pachydermatis]KOS15381.1 rsc complex protein [Malassezia pachydermatis]